LKVYKKKLDNGLTVLVSEINKIPKVSSQLWYNVGSKDEESKEKGIAHFIEHMIFKGTKKLSESDISNITYKLSGYCNAFTSYDYTGYLFEFPSSNWDISLSIMADCMRNCTFKEPLMKSEVKAVIQELKMYKDHHLSNLLESLLSSIFNDHPYRNPIIGYKQDLWSLKRSNLLKFYNKYYYPNNATLIVVGDINKDDVFKLAEKNFGYIAPKKIKKNKFYHRKYLQSYTVELYEDIKQPILVLAFEIEGIAYKKDYLYEIFKYIIASGKGSRLYKKLVNELSLASEVDAFIYDLFEYGLFVIYIIPNNQYDIDNIIEIINKEIDILKDGNIDDNEIERAIKKNEISYISILENNTKIASEIGKYFLATNDENYFYNYNLYPKQNLKSELINIANIYFDKYKLNIGKVLPIDQKDIYKWLDIQKHSDDEDSLILNKKIRNNEVEPPKEALNIEPRKAKKFNFYKEDILYLENDLKCLYYNNDILPKVDLILDFKVKSFYDDINLQGLTNLTFLLMQEGTKRYSSQEFADIIESHGINISISPGSIKMSLLKNDINLALDLLYDMITNASFDEKSINKVKSIVTADIKSFLDDPMSIAIDIAKKNIYKNHPYSNNYLGTIESINSITRDNILDFYKKYISSNDAILSISGDLNNININELLINKFKNLRNINIQSPDLSLNSDIHFKTIDYPMVRDQVTLLYAGLSSKRLNSDFNKLLIFDQIFTGGLLGSMSSRLFDLRERSGLFYTIGGSIVYDCNEVNGLILIKTIVSNDKLMQAEKEIENAINNSYKNVTDLEFKEAKAAIINAFVNKFSSNSKICSSFLSKHRLNLGIDYYDKIEDELNKIKKDDMLDVVLKYLNVEKMVKIRIGRLF